MFREKQRDITMTKQELIDFESEVAEYFEKAMIRGPVHLSHGNEDYLIDLFQYINGNDFVFSTWRNHYHALLHGVPKEDLMKKILDAHSISFQYPEKNFFTSAIVGGIIPIAVGTALGVKLKGDNRMVFCFIGDMAASSGTGYEGIKYSVFNELPIRFIIENNSLSTNTPSALSWGLKDDWDKRSIEAGFNWLTPEEKDKYISYFEYKREKFPHQGIGKFIYF